MPTRRPEASLAACSDAHNLAWKICFWHSMQVWKQLVDWMITVRIRMNSRGRKNSKWGRHQRRRAINCTVSKKIEVSVNYAPRTLKDITDGPFEVLKVYILFRGIKFNCQCRLCATTVFKSWTNLLCVEWSKKVESKYISVHDSFFQNKILYHRTDRLRRHSSLWHRFWWEVPPNVDLYSTL